MGLLRLVRFNVVCTLIDSAIMFGVKQRNLRLLFRLGKIIIVSLVSDQSLGKSLPTEETLLRTTGCIFQLRPHGIPVQVSRIDIQGKA